MAIDFRTKFDELFGAEEARASAPTLRDVAPGLIQGDSRFSSKELNPRRTSVSARNFRNPRVRSAEGAFERGGAVQTPQSGRGGGPTSITSPFERGAATRAGGGPGVEGVVGDLGGDIGPAPGTAEGLSAQIGNSLAGQVGTGFGQGAGLAAASGLAVNAPLGLIAPAAIGSGVSAALGPLGLLGLANTAIGSSLAFNEAMTASELGTSPEESAQFAQTVFSNQPHTLTGLLANNLGFGGEGNIGVGDISGLAMSADEGDPFAQGMSINESQSTQSPFEASQQSTALAANAAMAEAEQGGLTNAIGSSAVGQGISGASASLASTLGNLIGNPTGTGPDLGATGPSTSQGDPVSGNFGQAGLGTPGPGGPAGSPGEGAPTGPGGVPGMGVGPGAAGGGAGAK